MIRLAQHEDSALFALALSMLNLVLSLSKDEAAIRACEVLLSLHEVKPLFDKLQADTEQHGALQNLA
jgi:hypothetical protein